MSNSQKIPLINSLAGLNKSIVDNNNTLDGKSLPCHVTKVNGSIVTVKFDILPGTFNLPEVTVPVFGPEYIRYPIQIGDKGTCIAMSVSIGAVSGLGAGLPTMARPPALTSLVFLPIGNIDWSKVDPDKVVIYGPDGVIAQTESGEDSITIEPSKVTVTSQSAIYLEATNIFLKGVIHLNGPIVQDAGEMSGTAAHLIGPLTVDNDTISGGISQMTHTHQVKDVEPGSSTITSEKPS